MRVAVVDEGIPEAASRICEVLAAHGVRLETDPTLADLVVWITLGPPAAHPLPVRAPGVGVWVITTHADLDPFYEADVDVVHRWPDDADRLTRGARALLRRLSVNRRLGYAWDLFEHAPTFNAVIELTPGGPEIRVMNRALAALSDSLGADVVHAEVATYGDILYEAVSVGRPVEVTRERVSPRFGLVRENLRAVPTSRSEAGNPQVALLSSSLTMQMRAERQFAASESRLRAVVDLAADAILSVDPAGGVRLANRAAAALFGAGELVGRTLSDLLPGVPRDASNAVRTTVIRGDRRLPVRVTLGAPAEDGLQTVIIHDLELEQRDAERLLMADRLASLGTLAAGVGHEINNPLGVLLANVEFARRSAVGELAIALDESLEGIARIRAIVDDLRSFSNASAPEAGAVDLEDVVKRALRLLNNEIRHRARLATRFDRVPRVVGQVARLGQVVTHLITNALRAIPADRTGRIDVAVRAGDGDVLLEVRDDGVGIPEAELPRIFEPYFTSASIGEARGFGLATLHAVVISVGGHIEVESHAATGSRFLVHLPAHPEPTATPVPAKPAMAPTGGLRVLLVDDEPLIARAVARMLGSTCHVSAYKSTQEAMAALEAGEAVDVCLCDLMMPGDGGAVFAAALEQRRPDLMARTGFVTGGAFTDEARAFAARVGDRLLGKPFDRNSLHAFVAMLAAR